MNKFIILIIIIFLFSCTNIEFVYEKDEKYENPIYQKTAFQISGLNIPSMSTNLLKYYGVSNNPSYYLRVYINEDKTRRSVQLNQAVSKVDYELKFNYVLESKLNNCIVYEKDIYSTFSFVPKSSGYNYGSDQSLEKMYEMASNHSIEQFINTIYNVDLKKCYNED